MIKNHNPTSACCWEWKESEKRWVDVTAGKKQINILPGCE